MQAVLKAQINPTAMTRAADVSDGSKAEELSASKCLPLFPCRLNGSTQHRR
jgi:hypothetical protein